MDISISRFMSRYKNINSIFFFIVFEWDIYSYLATKRDGNEKEEGEEEEFDVLFISKHGKTSIEENIDFRFMYRYGNVFHDISEKFFSQKFPVNFCLSSFSSSLSTLIYTEVNLNYMFCFVFTDSLNF
jgi:hypothetical protein